MGEDKKFADTWSKASQAILKKKFEKAARLLAKIEAHGDKESRIVVRNNLGKDYEKMKQINKAMALYQANVDEGADTPGCYIRLAIHYERAKEYKKALDVVEKFFNVIDKLPRHYGVWGSAGTIDLAKRRSRLLSKLGTSKGELGQTVEKIYGEVEDPGTLFGKAMALEDTDIDEAIKTIRDVIGKYEAQRERFAVVKPAYLKLAHYLQKKGDQDGAWRIYNQMIHKAGREGDILRIGIHLSDIYSRMASLREMEKSYKDAALFKIRSFVNKNQALHVQAKRKELLALDDLVDNLQKLSKKGRIEGLQKLVKKALKPLVKEWRKKPPVKEPFVRFEKKESKIGNRYVVLDRIASKQIDLITKKLRQ